jgi:hypothetical protein
MYIIIEQSDDAHLYKPWTEGRYHLSCIKFWQKSQQLVGSYQLDSSIILLHK